jgi:hypothetical protein
MLECRSQCRILFEFIVQKTLSYESNIKALR